jgi:hypothetical protein
MESTTRPEESAAGARRWNRRGPVNLHRWLGVAQRLAPVLMILLVIAYEAGPSRWLDVRAGYQQHFIAELLFYGTLGPALVFVLLHFLRRWLEERETSELQSQILQKAHKHAQDKDATAEDALQALFAASVILNSLESKCHDLTSEEAAALKRTRIALDDTIRRLRSQLMD